MKKEDVIFGIGLATVFWITLILLCIEGVEKRGYRQGQIDALTGNIQIELVQNPDLTRTWQKK